MTPIPRFGSRVGPLWLAGAIAVAAGGAWTAMRGAPLVLSLVPAAVVLFGTLTIGVTVAKSGILARPLLRVDTTRPEVALTFDDGPDPRVTPAILDLLDAGGHHATFFVIGERAARHPELLAEIARRGHEIGNHTWDHRYLTPFYTPQRLRAELLRVNALVLSVTGHTPRWFRAPVGLLSPRIARGVALAQLQLVAWTATARDGVARTSAATAAARLTRAVTPGAILVLHDGVVGVDRTPVVVEAFKTVAQHLEARGLRSVTLGRLLDPS